MMLFKAAPVSRANGIERLAREAALLAEKRETEYRQIASRTILNRCSSDRVPFAWTINPYRGCEFGCRYCYARYTHEFMGLTRWEDFEQKIYVKGDAARILAKELAPSRLRGQTIAVGTATDPYQPAERRFKVTRALLAVMAQSDDLRVSIATKSDLVARDIDVLRRIARRSGVHVNMTVTTVDRRLARVLECRAPTPAMRLRAVRALSDAGIRVGIALSPILPDITDAPAGLDAVMAAARDHGAGHVFWNVLFLKPAAQHAFFPLLARHFPRLVARYAARFARSPFLDRAYTRRIADRIGGLKRKYGFPDHAPFETPPLVHEAESGQLPLFRIGDPVSVSASGPACRDTPPVRCAAEGHYCTNATHRV